MTEITTDFRSGADALSEHAAAEEEAGNNFLDELATAIREAVPPERKDGWKADPKPAELSEKDFEKLGPKAAEILKAAGVTKLSLTPAENGNHHIKAELKKGMEIGLHPETDGANKLKIGKAFSCDIKMGKDGDITLSNIKGLSAELNVGGVARDVPITGINMAFNADGKAEFKATLDGKKEQTILRPYEAMENAMTYYNKTLELMGLRCP